MNFRFWLITYSVRKPLIPPETSYSAGNCLFARKPLPAGNVSHHPANPFTYGKPSSPSGKRRSQPEPPSAGELRAGDQSGVERP
jgi:hypothetical protein